MIGTIAITDEGWYSFLSGYPELQEVNFWTPSARRSFRAPHFSPFIFKLRAPHNAICGFAFFAQYSHLPIWLAWESFGIGNGCFSQAEMEHRIARLRSRIRYESDEANDIGCILLVEPVFFHQDAWIPQPAEWHPRTQSYERYDLDSGEGKRIWDACTSQVRQLGRAIAGVKPAAQPAERYGSPHMITPRLGQGTFRIAVLDSYERACALTGEHSLPALEAAHIQPFADNGPHDVRNGLLFRADIHRLFDKGYVTVTEQHVFKVGNRLKREFDNGRCYYPLDGQRIRSPRAAELLAASEFLRWHNERVFRG